MKEDERKQKIEESLILLDTEEMAKYIGCTSEKIREIISRDKEFPAIRFGKGYKVLLSALVEYLSKRRIKEG